MHALPASSTREQLIAALGRAKTTNGNLYFTGTTGALFPAVIRATMGGTTVGPADIGVGSTGVAAAGGKSAESIMEKQP